MIFHITTTPEWDRARRDGAYRAESLDAEGFIHCSLPTQVNHVADWFYREIPDLVLLCIDPEELTSELRYEPSADAFAGEFPHVYGPIDLEAVVAAMPWAAGENGFALPDHVHDLLDG
ncbi:MAG TPA: DUF952 domain-containing protein [Acidimicrobiia bacterium]|nr:DUF952 domain-containing protein [Acidimicrobiia bacterium]